MTEHPPQAGAKLPAALAAQTRFVRLGPGAIPALLAHPDWATPAPTVVWLHGRTVNKELDNGRYLRWIRAGFAACAIDLPGHGERFDAHLQQPRHVLELLQRALPEIDQTVTALGGGEFRGVFDLARLALGGMSAGGMITLRRLCEAHPFRCAAVEGTAGDLALLYTGDRAPSPTDQPVLAALNPITHLDGWRPIPLLALHSEADEIVPLACIKGFVDALRARAAAEAVPDAGRLVTLKTWPTTGAPQEHSGFGRVANEAKTAQVDFLRHWLVGQGGRP